MIRLRSLLFVLIIALSLTAVTIVFADAPPPSTNGQPEPQIVGGQVAALGDRPWASSTVSWVRRRRYLRAYSGGSSEGEIVA